jgi:hypothetical protein
VSTANAGPTQIICTGSTTLAANQPAAGESGYWDIVVIPPGSSNPTFANNSLYTYICLGTLRTGMYVFQWSITKPGALSGLYIT